MLSDVVQYVLDLLDIRNYVTIPPIIVGIDESNDPKLPFKDALVDNQRIDYYDRHFDYLHTAIFK